MSCKHPTSSKRRTARRFGGRWFNAQLHQWICEAPGCQKWMLWHYSEMGWSSSSGLVLEKDRHLYTIGEWKLGALGTPDVFVAEIPADTPNPEALVRELAREAWGRCRELRPNPDEQYGPCHICGSETPERHGRYLIGCGFIRCGCGYTVEVCEECLDGNEPCEWEKR